MALQLKTENSKKVASNTIQGKEVVYTYEVSPEGTVISVQAYFKNPQEFRISAHYDPTSKGLMIGVNDMPDNFNASIYTSVANDIMKIIKGQI